MTYYKIIIYCHNQDIEINISHLSYSEFCSLFLLTRVCACMRFWADSHIQYHSQDTEQFKHHWDPWCCHLKLQPLPFWIVMLNVYHVIMYNLYILFGKVSVHVLCDFLIELFDFFFFFFCCCVWDIFSPSVACVFVFFISTFQRANVFNIDEVDFTNFYFYSLYFWWTLCLDVDP